MNRLLVGILLISSDLFPQAIEKELVRTAHDAEYAVAPIWFADPANISNSFVAGTGFFVTSGAISSLQLMCSRTIGSIQPI